MSDLTPDQWNALSELEKWDTMLLDTVNVITRNVQSQTELRAAFAVAGASYEKARMFLVNQAESPQQLQQWVTDVLVAAGALTVFKLLGDAKCRHGIENMRNCSLCWDSQFDTIVEEFASLGMPDTM